MRNFNLMYLGLCAFFCSWLCSCSSMLQIRPIEGFNQSIIYRDGTKILVSNKKFTVSIYHDDEHYAHTSRPTFIVNLNNRTQSPVDFSTENISAYLHETPCKIYSYEELVEEVKTGQTLSKLVLGAATAFGATTAYKAGDRAGLEMVRNNLQRTNQEIDQSANQSIESLRKIILKKHTVFSNESHGGYFQIDEPKKDDKVSILRIRIEVADEIHFFEFNI